MRPLHVKLDRRTRNRLEKLRREANEDGEYKIARRIEAILLNADGHTSGEISRLFDVNRGSVTLWIKRWSQGGFEGLLEGHRPGRTSRLDEKSRQRLCEILRKKPRDSGFVAGGWSSTMVGEVIKREFKVHYHPAHIQNILHSLGFAVEHPRRRWVWVGEKKPSRWVRYNENEPVQQRSSSPKRAKKKTRRAGSKTRRAAAQRN